MIRKLCRTVTVGALAAAAVTAGGGASNAAEDVTCTVVAVLAPAVPRVTVAVGEVYGDGYVAEAVVACAGPGTGHHVSGTLSVWYEYQPYDGAPFQRVPGCGEVHVTGGGAYGTLVLSSPPMVCSSFGQSWARRPVRAHAVFTRTSGGWQYHGYSAVL